MNQNLSSFGTRRPNRPMYSVSESDYEAYLDNDIQNIGTRRPMFHVSDSESCLANEAQITGPRRPSRPILHVSESESYLGNGVQNIEARRGSRPMFHVSESESYLPNGGQHIETRRPSRPLISRVSESESYVSQETQFTDFENSSSSVLKPSLPSGFFKQRSASSASGGEHANHLQQCETIIKSHHKLKVYFTVLFVVNIILIIIVVILIMFCVFFLMMARDAEDKNKPYSTQPSPSDNPRTDALKSECLFECQKLALYGLTPDKECCNLDDAFTSTKQYLDKKIQSISYRPGGGRPAISTAAKPVIHMVGGKPAERSTNPHFIKGWTCNGGRGVSQGFDGLDCNKGRDFITLPKNGLYFIYSRIHFTVKQKTNIQQSANGYQMPVAHTLYRRKVGDGVYLSIQDSSLKCPMQNDTSVVHSSYLEGIIYLQQGDEIKIGLTYGEKLEYDMTNKDNYFGLFEL